MLNIILIIAAIVLLCICWANGSDENAWLFILPTIPATWLLYRLGMGFPTNIILAAAVGLCVTILGTIRNEKSSKSERTQEKPATKSQHIPPNADVPTHKTPVQSPVTFADTLVRTPDDVIKEHECILRDVNHIINNCKYKSKKKAAIGEHSVFMYASIIHREYATKETYMGAVRARIREELKQLGFSDVSVSEAFNTYSDIEIRFRW